MNTSFEQGSERPPMTLGYDREQRKLTVRGASEFPAEAYDYPDAEILDLSYGYLRELPADLGDRFKKAKVAFLSYNDGLEAVPDFSGFPALEILGMRASNLSTFDPNMLPNSIRAVILTENKIANIPAAIGKYGNLQKLFMTGNELTSLPQELANCVNLEIVRFPVNNIAEPPEWLFRMPRLAWYADSSNPYSPKPTEIPKTYEWKDLTFPTDRETLLGKSNNNEVRLAILPDGAEVAVKLFGHQIVSDGRPEDDMNACLLAGDHDNVVGGLGKVLNTPDGRQALVMTLLPAHEYAQVGNPPSFETICRDTYPDDTTLSQVYVMNAVRTLASGYAHLHSRGIQHGDAYNHNTIGKRDGTCRVSDFGGASIYKKGSQGGELRQRLDVLAFGRQMGEFLSRCVDITDRAALQELQVLQAACEQENVLSRPSFNDIVEVVAHNRLAA